MANPSRLRRRIARGVRHAMAADVQAAPVTEDLTAIASGFVRWTASVARLPPNAALLKTLLAPAPMRTARYGPANPRSEQDLPVKGLDAYNRAVVRYASRSGAAKPMLSRRSVPSTSTISGSCGHAPAGPRRRISARTAVECSTTISDTVGIVR